MNFGFVAIGITDHDTVKGVRPAVEHSKDIEIVPGVELSCIYQGIDVHILGYFIDYKTGLFEERLSRFQLARRERAEEMVKKLALRGVKIEIERILEVAKDGAVGRPHIARVLIEKGYASSVDDAFARFIGYHCDAYVPKLEMSIEQGISLIKEFRGVSVLAHPSTYNNREVIEYSIEKGINGIEVWHPEHSQRDVEEYLSIAHRRGILITGGSDSHGGGKGKDLFGKIKIEERYLKELKNFL